MSQAGPDQQPPLCFILMPSGTMPAPDGRRVDFNAVYHEIIAPAVSAAGMQPIRAELEKDGGIKLKAIYERFILCDYAIADLTIANATVFYQLGVRHAESPFSTALIYAETVELFDVNGPGAIQYRLGDNGKPVQSETSVQRLSRFLLDCRNATNDHQTHSSIYQVLQHFPEIQRLKTDVFRDQVAYSENIRYQLTKARELCFTDRQAAIDAVDSVYSSISSLTDAEAALIIDLLLSFRALERWHKMIHLVEALPVILAETVLVQEQYGLALNRTGRGEEAERVLKRLIDKHGPSSETNSILGRVYKDRWNVCKHQDNTALAQGLLQKAIDTYLKGFESDWRDAYPGINALKLMEQSSPPDPRRIKLNPVVRFAVERRIASGRSDYWDYATLVELAVLANDPFSASNSFSKAQAMLREPWEAESTARDLTLIRDLRAKRSEDTDWLEKIISQLEIAGVSGE